MLSHLEELLEAKNIFIRKRYKIRTRTLGILMYHYGLSLRKCRTILSSFEVISHESIRKRYHKTDAFFSVERCYREVIDVDKIKLKINGRPHILKAAINICNWEILDAWITKVHASIQAYSLLKYILKRCVNQP